MANIKFRYLIYLFIILILCTFIFQTVLNNNLKNISIVFKYLPKEESQLALSEIKSGQYDLSILSDYGYSSNFWSYPEYYILIFLIIILFTSIMLIEIRFSKTEKTIDNESLIKYINDLNSGTAPIFPPKQDKLGVYDKLYKVYTQNLVLKENAEKSRLNFKNNLDDIAHQIKTPVTSMLMKLENGADANELQFSLKKLDELTDQLLHLSALDSGAIPMKHNKFSIYSALLESFDQLEPIFEQKNISVNIHSTDSVFVGDYYWITEAFMNIFKNAANYLDNNTRLDVFVEDNPLYIKVSFKDNGKGIENVQNVFRRFYKTPDSNGFGLGLNIAKSIAEKNSGDLIAYNEKGAVFEFNFYKD